MSPGNVNIDDEFYQWLEQSSDDEVRWFQDEEFQHLYSQSQQSPLNSTSGPFYKDLTEPFPNIQNFGIMYLSVPHAASILAQDLFETGRYPFTTQEISNPLNAKREAIRAESSVQLTAQIEAHLLKAIKAGRLTAISKRAGIHEFLEDGDDPLIPKRLYLHCGDLRKWLAINGYAEQWFLSHCPSLAAYEADEITLSRKIEHLIRTWRHNRKVELSEIKLQEEKTGTAIKDRREALSGTLHEDEGVYEDYKVDFPEFVESPDFSSILRRAFSEIRELRKQLQAALNPSSPTELSKNETRSLLITLAAVCKWKGIDGDSPNLASQIVREVEQMGQRLSPNTIRKWLSAALQLIPPSKLEISARVAKSQLNSK